jgi:hypothetical protein
MVDFTAVECFEETAVKDSVTDVYLYGILVPVVHEHSSDYNIVHVVHGSRTWRGDGPLTSSELTSRNFYNEYITRPNRRVRKTPAINSPNYERDKIGYRRYRLYKASQKIAKYK